MSDNKPTLPYTPHIMVKTMLGFKDENIPLYTAEQMYAFRQEGLDQSYINREIVGWQYRWTNPDNTPGVHADALQWQKLDTRGIESMTQRVAEMRAYSYKDRPCYDVRPIYASTGA